MRFPYYPGCALPWSSAEFDISMRAVFPKMDIGLDEIRGWICCG